MNNFSEVDAALYLAVVRHRLADFVRDGRLKQNEDGTFSRDELDRFIRREWDV